MKRISRTRSESYLKMFFVRHPLKGMIYSTPGRRFVPDEGVVAGCADRIWYRSHAKRKMQMAEMIFKYDLTPVHGKFVHIVIAQIGVYFPVVRL